MAKAKSARLSCQERISRAEQIVRTSSFPQAAIGRRHHGLKPAGVAERANKRPAGLIDIGMIDVPADFLAGPFRQTGAEFPVFLAEKRPSQMFERRHQ